MDIPFFSVISPNYNSGNKLLRAAKSLSSNKISFEHIIVDDCSTDGSLDLLGQMDSSTRIVRNEKNLGPGPSRNRGLELSRGRYILFLDSDDFFIYGALDCIHRVLIERSCPDVLVFGYHLVRIGRFDPLDSGVEPEVLDVSVHNQSGLLRMYFLDEIVSAPWGKCISSELAKKVKFPSLRVSQDAFYNLDVFLQADTAVIADKELYIFDKSDSKSLTSKPFDYEEFKKFYRSWIAFEKKVLGDKALDDYEELLYARKIKFCVLYYMNRLALTPQSDIDPKVIRFVKGIFLRNFWQARKSISRKSIAASFLFCVFPRFTLRVLRARLLRKVS